MLGGKARALLAGNAHVSTDDIAALAHPALRHRVLLSYKAEAEGVTIEDVIDRLLAIRSCGGCLMDDDLKRLTHSGSDSANIDPTAVMRIKDLQLQAKTVVDGFFSGLHRSPVHGSSVEFSEYRPYTVGDDFRGLDWKLYARSDRYFIKKFEDETNRNCYLILDQSKSMGYGSLEYTKIQYARTLAATLAYYLTRQRDAVGLVTFDETIGDFISAKNRVGQFHQLMVCLSKPLRGSGTDIAGPLKQIASLVHRRGLIVLISDLLTPVDSLQTNFAYLRSRGHEVVILRDFGSVGARSTAFVAQHGRRYGIVTRNLYRPRRRTEAIQRTIHAASNIGPRAL